MTNQFTIVMPEPEIERLRLLAAQQQQELEEFAAEQLRTIARETKNGAGNGSNGHHRQENVIEDWTTPDPAFDREEAAYIAMHPKLKETHFVKHVAIYGGKLIDEDNNRNALYNRIDAQYPDEFVWMTEVKDEPIDILYMRSPRFTPRH